MKLLQLFNLNPTCKYLGYIPKRPLQGKLEIYSTRNVYYKHRVKFSSKRALCDVILYIQNKEVDSRIDINTECR